MFVSITSPRFNTQNHTGLLTPETKRNCHLVLILAAPLGKRGSVVKTFVLAGTERKTQNIFGTISLF